MIAPILLGSQQHQLLENVPWASYEQLLDEIGNRPIRVTFWHGRMEIMSPLPEHDGAKSAISRLLEVMTLDFEIPFRGYGSATFRREEKEAGLEPDECYYLQNESKVLGMKRFDPTIHPAPDLALEIDIHHPSIAREPIYAALGVPELWRYDGTRITVRILQAGGMYTTVKRSPSFPFLPLEQFEAYVHRMEAESYLTVLRDFRKWIRTLPRD